MLLRTSLFVGLTLATMGANGDGCESDPAQSQGYTDADSLDDLAALDGDAAVEPAPTPLAVESDLRYLREEEKLARDVYRNLGARWGLQVFSNIASSEQTHTTQVATRLAELGLADPVVDDSEGVFVDTSLASLFVDLTTAGAVSVEAALQVGATIEDLDIADLATKRTHTDDPATLAVYDALMCGSRNHMRAFVGQLDMRGQTYAAQYLTQAEVDAIVQGAREQCGGN